MEEGAGSDLSNDGGEGRTNGIVKNSSGPAKPALAADRTLVGWSEMLRQVGREELATGFDTDILRDFALLRG